MGYIQELRELVGHRPLIMPGANVIVVDKNNRLLLQLRSDNKCWGLPGGAMEPGETLKEVAKRELFEETNLVANNLTLFNVYSGEEFYYKYRHGDEVYNVITTFICTEYAGVMKKDEHEVLDLAFFHYDELPSEISPPEIPILNEFITTYFNKKNGEKGGGNNFNAISEMSHALYEQHPNVIELYKELAIAESESANPAAQNKTHQEVMGRLQERIDDLK